jgi:small subunit ribosomal protein S10
MAQATSPKIRIKIKAYDHRVIDSATNMIIEAIERTGALIAGPIPLPTRIKKFTILRSTFVNKNSREQFEIRTHKRIIDITESTSKTVDALSNITLPAGVEIEVKMLTA